MLLLNGTICHKFRMVSKTKETYGFGSLRAPPRLKELKDFDKDLVKLMQYQNLCTLFLT
jgi:hypothetical protein